MCCRQCFRINTRDIGFIKSYDVTTHFETTVTDVLNMYTMITGKVWDYTRLGYTRYNAIGVAKEHLGFWWLYNFDILKGSPFSEETMKADRYTLRDYK